MSYFLLVCQSRCEAVGLHLPTVDYHVLGIADQSVDETYRHAVLIEGVAVYMVLLSLKAAYDVLTIVKLHNDHQHHVAADDGAPVVTAILPARGLGADVSYLEHMVVLSIGSGGRTLGG